MKAHTTQKGLAVFSTMYPALTPNNINLIQTVSPDDKYKILHSIPLSIYIDDDTFEIDKYAEVSFYLKNGDLLQNKVGQEYVTRTIQGSFQKSGESVSEAIMRLGIRDSIEILIYYVHCFRTNFEKIVENYTSVSIINWQ